MRFILFYSTIVLLFITGCGTFQSPREDVIEGIKAGKVYRHDMKVCVDGECGDGVLVIPLKADYKFNVESYGNLDLFKFTTCHREETTQEFAKKKRWYGKKGNRKAHGSYRPIPGVESAYCPIELAGLDKRGRHSWGFIDVRTPLEKLNGKLYCNGIPERAEGVSVCQSKVGLRQRIVFEVPVKVESSAGCKIKAGGQAVEFKMKKGKCVYAFFDKDKNIHRLTTIGYDAIIVRED